MQNILIKFFSFKTEGDKNIASNKHICFILTCFFIWKDSFASLKYFDK